VITNKTIRLSLLHLNGFLGATSVAGGLGILVGLIPLPLEALDGSPFANYVIPGVILLIVVGGSGLTAALAVLRNHELGALASLFAALMIISFEAVEIATIGFHWLQAPYLAIGVVIAILSWRRSMVTLRAIASIEIADQGAPKDRVVRSV
jgi:hypothetical protein